ncbi:MAG TPA: hypothetical protein DER09_11675 [Prolixibacteraceae bacterium]|nr:hypothetical protein [Prolixibacteraceae bacterium]
MKKQLSVILIFCFSIFVSAQKPTLLKLKYEQNYTVTYDEAINMFKLLDEHYENAVLLEKGLTDCGKPLHLFVMNSEPEFNPEKIRQQGKTILLINNGIHAGEPEGIDTSLEFADDVLRNKDGLAELLKKTVIIIIPVYNIGGVLNRSAYNRSGQTTPYETGFRGNYANLDLNRDFTKCDSENARSFSKIFTEWNPDVFLDTHTTNGSDHQYSITYIQPSPALYPAGMEKYIRNSLVPALYSGMKNGKYELIPYVDYFYDDPKNGIASSLTGARFSSGFAGLFHSYGMMTENQIYRNFPDRVKSCYQFIQVLAEFTAENGETIRKTRKEGIRESMIMTKYPVAFEIDTTQFRMIEFKGYEVARGQISPVTGLPRFGYDLSKPYTAQVKYFDVYKKTEFIDVPEFYILPQYYRLIIEKLDMLQIGYTRLQRDSIIEATMEYIDDFTSPTKPYNGHFYHDKITTHSEKQQVQFYAGDLVIPVRQEKIKYLLEMFEPKATDSFFRWNFFDNVLDQREYFSSYGFEANALKYLNEHPEFKAKFDEKRKTDTEFAKNHRAQLAYLYNNTEWLEKTWKRYPVGKIFK